MRTEKLERGKEGNYPESGCTGFLKKEAGWRWMDGWMDVTGAPERKGTTNSSIPSQPSHKGFGMARKKNSNFLLRFVLFFVFKKRKGQIAIYLIQRQAAVFSIAELYFRSLLSASADGMNERQHFFGC